MQLKIFLFINGIINSIMLQYAPFGILQAKYKFNKYYALAAIVLLDTLIILPRTIGDAGPSLLNTIMTCGHPILWCILLFKDPLWKKLTVVIGFNLVVMLPLEFISMGFMYLFWGGSFFDDIYAKNNIYLAGLTLNNILYFIALIFVILLWRRFVDKKKSTHMPVYIAIATYQSILLALWLRVAVHYSDSTKWIGCALEVFGFIVDLILFYFFEQMNQQLETEEQLAALYRQRDFEQEYYEASMLHLNHMKQMHKEFASRIHDIYVAVQQPDYKENMKQLLHQSQDKIQKSKQTVYSLHPVMNALLIVKRELAESKNIHMEIHCTHSHEIGVTDIDICSVLGNLLDNAIEACEKIDSANRIIIADINEKSGYLIVKISNSISPQTPEIKRIGFTSKTDSENHGLGLRMVERICSKYDGKLLLSPSGDMMNASAILRQNSI